MGATKTQSWLVFAKLIRLPSKMELCWNKVTLFGAGSAFDGRGVAVHVVVLCVVQQMKYGCEGSQCDMALPKKALQQR